METEEMLDWMLEEAKSNPMKICHDFDTRFRVWVDQIIPSRLNAIRQCKGDVQYTLRMVDLTTKDLKRLRDRAIDEASFEDIDHPESVLYERATDLLSTFAVAIEDYLKEVKQ